MTNKKIRIAVRLKDGTKRLYGLEDHGLSIVEFSGGGRRFMAQPPLERKVMHLETRMTDYKRVQTSAEVWAVIRARHPEMRVFGSYSAPGGDQFGDPSKGKMFTSYGFEHGDYPVMEAQTTWDIDPEKPHKRNNQQHEYWLCLPKREDA